MSGKWQIPVEKALVELRDELGLLVEIDALEAVRMIEGFAADVRSARRENYTTWLRNHNSRCACCMGRHAGMTFPFLSMPNLQQLTLAQCSFGITLIPADLNLICPGLWAA